MKSFNIVEIDLRLPIRRSVPISLREIIALAFAILASIAMVGCKKSREDEALERIANHKPPGYVRFVNFSDSDVTPTLNGATQATVGAGKIGVFIIRPSGKQKTTVKAGEKSIFEESLVVDPGSSATVVASSKGVKVYHQTTRVGQSPESAVHVIMASDSGQIKVESDNESLFDKVGAESESDFKAITAGHHKISIKTADGKSASGDQEFMPGDAYTVFVSVGKAGPEIQIVKDSPELKPTMNGNMAKA